jgi:hypothetical protein
MWQQWQRKKRIHKDMPAFHIMVKSENVQSFPVIYNVHNQINVSKERTTSQLVLTAFKHYISTNFNSE